LSGYSRYVTSYLMRGWVCRLELMLVLVSAVILRSVSRGTHDHILLSQIGDSPTRRARSPYLCPSGTGWSGYTPRHWVPISSPTTRKATVEVLDPASTRAPLLQKQHSYFICISILWVKLSHCLSSNGCNFVIDCMSIDNSIDTFYSVTKFSFPAAGSRTLSTLICGQTWIPTVLSKAVFSIDSP
jgi:hypothetical protein